MRSFIVLLVLTSLLGSCKKGNIIDSSEIEKLVNLQNVKILQNKKFQVSQRPGMEDVVLAESAGKKYLLIFSPEKRSFIVLRKTELPDTAEFLKLSFLSIGSGTSHILLLLKVQQTTGLHIYDGEKFYQHIPLKNEEVEKLYIQKNEEKPNDDLILTMSEKLRFNGLYWTHYQEDEIFPYVETLMVENENSYIEIVNRGGFGSRAIFTLSFPDIKGKPLAQYLKLTKDIPNVRLYKAGYSAHRYKGGNINLSYPIIEVIKESYSRGIRVKLPLFMKPGIGRVHLRAVYFQRGQSQSWPSVGSYRVVTDQQNYFAFETDPR